MLFSLFLSNPLYKQNRVSILRVGLTVLSILILLLLRLTNLEEKTLQVGRIIAHPLLSVNTRVAASINRSLLTFKSQYQLARQVQDLQLRLAQTTAQLGELDQLRLENNELRNLLNSTDRSLGRVVLTQPILSYAQPTISVPPQEELAVGTAVLAEGTLVGTISKLLPGIAQIDLLWQKETMPVLAATSEGVQGLVIGDGRRVLLTEIPVAEEIEVGQRVVTTGQRGIERGVLIGEIRSIQAGPSAAVKTAVLEQYVSFFETALVEIRL